MPHSAGNIILSTINSTPFSTVEFTLGIHLKKSWSKKSPEALDIRRRMCYTTMAIGVWLSPVECLVRDQEAAGSNPVTPMRKTAKSLRFGGLLIFAFSGLTTGSTINRQDFGIRFFWFVLLWFLPPNALLEPVPAVACLTVSHPPSDLPTGFQASAVRRGRSL